jgi:hypothetical protein
MTMTSLSPSVGDRAAPLASPPKLVAAMLIEFNTWVSEQIYDNTTHHVELDQVTAEAWERALL